MKKEEFNKVETFTFESIYPEPNYAIQKNRDWINFGVDNLAPIYIEKLIDQSPVHSSILNGTILLTNGDGFAEPMNPIQLAIYNNENTDESFDFNKTDLNSILPFLIRDQITYGAFALNIRWSEDRKTIADYSYVEVSNLRMTSDERGYLICEDWRNPKKNPSTFFHKFSTNEEIKDEFPSQILYVRSNVLKQNYYALPIYWSAREVIESDQELDSHNLNRLRNNFVPSTIIKYNGVPQKEQRDALYKQLKNFYSGSRNASKTLVLFDNQITIEPFSQSTTPSDYFEIQSIIYQKITTVWGVVGKGGLFGLNLGEGGMDFSTDSLLNEFNVYSKMRIRPYQKQLEDVFNKMSKINGYEGDESFQIIPLKLFEGKETIDATTNLDGDNNLIIN